jgi:hypothetical protein
MRNSEIYTIAGHDVNSTCRLLSSTEPILQSAPDSGVQFRLLSDRRESNSDGGLRVKGRYKHSYEICGSKWRIMLCGDAEEVCGDDIVLDDQSIQSESMQYVKQYCKQLADELNEPYKTTVSLPLISIITVVYNGEKHLEETIESVMAQTYPNIEYIVIDGASNDGTLGIIKKYNDRIDYWISEKDSGIYDAINKGIMYATGDAIGVLNSDDILYPDACSTVVRYLLNNKWADFVFGAMMRDKVHCEYKPNKIYWSFSFFPGHSASFFIRKKAQSKIGYYNTKYRCSADYDLFYRMIVNKKMKGISTKGDEVVGRFREGGYSNKIDYYDHLVEQTRIRIDKGQNRLVVLILFVLRYLKNLKNIDKTR